MPALVLLTPFSIPLQKKKEKEKPFKIGLNDYWKSIEIVCQLFKNGQRTFLAIITSVEQNICLQSNTPNISKRAFTVAL
jgi:hypothetical protein